VVAGDEVDLAPRATVTLATVNAIARSRRAAVDAIFGMASASALFDDNPLQPLRATMAANQRWR
jgi:hypothetical protein